MSYTPKTIKAQTSLIALNRELDVIDVQLHDDEYMGVSWAMIKVFERLEVLE
jgi:hypothetical protein